MQSNQESEVMSADSLGESSKDGLIRLKFQKSKGKYCLFFGRYLKRLPVWKDS